MFVFIFDNVINVDELLYIKSVKNGKLFVCIFKDKQDPLFLSVEEAEKLNVELKKLSTKKIKSPKKETLP